MTIIKIVIVTLCDKMKGTYLQLANDDEFVHA